MELLPYQQQVLDDLADFLRHLEQRGNLKDAFQAFWHQRSVARPEPYQQSIPRVPHVCIKVPTGGGKTFIAANAIHTVFEALNIYRRKAPRAVVWLVPSNAILDQTLNALSDPGHPYRRKLDSLFSGRVAVYAKDTLLQGAGFNAAAVHEQLNIFVLSYASFRTGNKEGRKAYQENPNLDGFVRQMDPAEVLAETDESALINVIRSMKPLCIVDESHNARSKLSLEMLENFNPGLILDLTATPRTKSNIISYVDAAQLKTYHMVKLPVIVYNHRSAKEVVSNAIQLRNNLEKQATTEKEAGGDYIRPIVLVQAESKTGKEDRSTFEDIKKRLLHLGIAKEEIAIKTAKINELKNQDLLSPTCPIRYIITVNALKEGWDCPFAYILATVANRHSQVDVEQIVGRVLRQPYARRQHQNLLNNSYVLASSADFLGTLDKIVAGLNQAGFSRRDVRAAEVAEPSTEPDAEQGQESGGSRGTVSQPGLFDVPLTPQDSETKGAAQSLAPLETTPLEKTDEGNGQGNLPPGGLDNAADNLVAGMLEHAEAQSRKYEEQAGQDNAQGIAEEVREKMHDFTISGPFQEQLAALRLPRFYIRVPGMSLFEDTFLLNKEELLKGFRLGQADSRIDFQTIRDDAYQIDLEEVGDHDYRPSFWKLGSTTRERLVEYLIALPPESRKQQVARRLCDLIGNMYPIADQEVKKYVRRIFEDMSSEQIHDCLEREYSYRDKIKAKIRELAAEYAETLFYQWLDADKILLQEDYILPDSIHPLETAPAVPKSLYEAEGRLNNWEAKVINEVANLDNILFWHKIIERKGFCINGFLNHYPDFLIRTRNGTTLLLEAKGDDRDNSDSARKLKLGRAWAAKAGNAFRYFMVFDSKEVEGAYRLEELLTVVGGL
ncbi:DEAD/DEAH box helicase [Candidatus Electrothrix sp.]|uniref:DEAD/DEAH box helicase n=1 Tax=Candidatus Electrothrix sp. TaxID=2170559 RepID=UPI004057BFD4